MRDAFTYETTLSPHNRRNQVIGDIDVRITYAVNSPAESAEIDVTHVEMLNAPKSGHKAVYIDAWDWIYDWAIEWCNEFASELAGAARL